MKILFKNMVVILAMLFTVSASAQEHDSLNIAQADTAKVYKKRVLETTEVSFLSSYYTQEGSNAAVSGGLGNEQLEDATATIVVAVPLNDDSFLKLDATVSAYSSASSSNINPFDGREQATPFQASSGASSSDTWVNVTAMYQHSSDDRNKIWSAKATVSSEYDYSSIGVGGTYARLFNEKNTELSVSANVFFDQWYIIYPIELRTGGVGDDDDDDDDEHFDINQYTISGTNNYAPSFTPFNQNGRNTYALGLGFSQILHPKVQASLMLDMVQQQGLLSTPFQRVYFADVENAYIEDFQLADDVERLPNTRFKTALGGRLNCYLNSLMVMRAFARYYIDNWGVSSFTSKVELPVKLSRKLTVYPSYRFYQQSAAQYFKPYDTALSTDAFYTSDYDLSAYHAKQLGFGLSYKNPAPEACIWKFALKSFDLRAYRYKRTISFVSHLITAGCKFVIE